MGNVMFTADTNVVGILPRILIISEYLWKFSHDFNEWESGQETACTKLLGPFFFFPTKITL